MSSPRNDLVDLITNSGVSHESAEAALNRCEAAMLTRGILGGESAALLGFFLTRGNAVAATLWGLGGAGVGAGSALLSSPQCSEVRDAALFWLKDAEMSVS
jgi:hypothetical protein